MGVLTGGPGAVTLAPGDAAAVLAAVRAQLRLETDGDDALVLAFAETALGLAEQFVGRALIRREMVAELEPAPGWQALPVLPVRAITAVAAGRPPMVLAADSYAVDIDAEARGWVRAPKAAAPLTVSFAAGEAAGWGELPQPIRQGVALLAAHLFADREGNRAPPAAVTALWRPFRAARLSLPVRA